MPVKKPAPSTVGIQLPLVDIVHATRPTLWTSIDLNEHGIDAGRAERLSELPPADRMLLAQFIPGLTYREQKVAGAIAYRGWWCWPSIADIAMNSNLAENHVSSSIKALEKKAGLRRFKPKGQSHRYLFSGLAIAAADDARSEREAALKGSRNGTSKRHGATAENSQSGSFSYSEGEAAVAESSQNGSFPQPDDTAIEQENSRFGSFQEQTEPDRREENSQIGRNSEEKSQSESVSDSKNSQSGNVTGSGDGEREKNTNNNLSLSRTTSRSTPKLGDSRANAPNSGASGTPVQPRLSGMLPKCANRCGYYATKGDLCSVCAQQQEKEARRWKTPTEPQSRRYGNSSGRTGGTSAPAG